MGLKSHPSIFLLPDAQILNEKFLEDINNILNIGEIPNLYPPDDKEALISDMKEITDKEKLQLSPLQVWEHFVKQCKMNLHVILYLSPVGKLKERLRNFPSLVSCTSTIWLQPWTQEALNEVAVHYLEDPQIASCCVQIHHSVQEMTDTYYNETSRRYYVTPLSYMKMLRQFGTLYEVKREEKLN